MIEQIKSMSLKQKLGQLFMVGFEGDVANEHIKKMIEELHVGGVIYFRRNVSTNKQIMQLSNSLQALAAKSSSIPLSISIDQEGGMVSRIDQEVIVAPGQMTIGATGNYRNAYEAGKLNAMELIQLGVTMNFAPVLDVNNNPLNPVIGIRSFGEDAHEVAKFGVEMIKGYQETGMLACAKHFPGHGDTSVDSHEALPSVSHPIERIHQIELVPFKAAITQKVDMIMTAHVQFPAIEPNNKPATLSAKVLTELLRQELGFEGVIVTDCLEMNAISEGVGVARGTVEAFKAGADLLLVSHSIDRQLAAYHALEQAVLNKEISESRIDESVTRILKMKFAQQLRINEQKLNFLPIQHHTSFEKCHQIIKQAVTLVQDKSRNLPLVKEDETLVIWPEMRFSTQVDEIMNQKESLGSELLELGGHLQEVKIGAEPTDEEIDTVLSEIESGKYKQIIIGLYNAAQFKGQIRLIEAIKKASAQERVIYISFRSPYDRTILEEDDTYICAYENRTQMLKAVSKALYGEVDFLGKLPVQL